MVTFEEYEALCLDRPKKFTPEEVGYRLAKPNEPACGSCVHFYVGVQMKHNVCEIMRNKEEQIEPEMTCSFQNRGEEYPLLTSSGD